MPGRRLIAIGAIVAVLVAVAGASIWVATRADEGESWTVVHREVPWSEAMEFCSIPPIAQLHSFRYGQNADGSQNDHQQYFVWSTPTDGTIETLIRLYDDGTISEVGTRCANNR